MCGIFGYIGPDDKAATIVLEGLKRLEYRGYDSWGVAVLPRSTGTKASDSEVISVKKRVGKIGDATVDELDPAQGFRPLLPVLVEF